MKREVLVFDTECYRNYWMVAFRNVKTGNVRAFEMYDGQALDLLSIRKIIYNRTLVGFNSNNYDIPMIAYALSGATNTQLKDASDSIILHGLKSWQFYDKFKVSPFNPEDLDTIDLIEVAPGIAGLKIYGGRMHAERMQDLPIDPDDLILPEQRHDMREYCANDLVTTQELYETLTPQIELRIRMGEEFGADLRSKSDAQIAEVVLRHGVEKLIGRRVDKQPDMLGHTFRYHTPSFIEFTSPNLIKLVRDIETHEFVVGQTGSVMLPDFLAKEHIVIAGAKYSVGIGGLHSNEKTIAHKADEDTILVDRDVTAYYPSIILGTGLYPPNMGKPFLTAYKQIVDRRVEAKRKKDKVTDDALKITINGSFGKFGSKYSILYAPNLLIQTTITGQLCMLMLIERLEAQGIKVVSANTDGIVIKCPKALEDRMEGIIFGWETSTRLNTEATYYTALYSRDVNNYVALKQGGGAKLKGVFAFGTISKNPNNEVCLEAVVKHLLNGTPVADTVKACKDIRKFVTIRTVRGGALKDGHLLGKAVRWYYGQGEEGTIVYKVNGYTVPRSEGAVPCMQLPLELPDDIDLDWYIKESNDIMESIGA